MPAVACLASGASITTLCCSTVPSANTAAEPRARITAKAGPYESRRLSTADGDGGAVVRLLELLDHPAAPATGEEAEGPPDQHQDPVLEADQIEDVDAEPEEPRGEPTHFEALDVCDRARAADRGDVALVAVAERLVIAASLARPDDLGHVAPLLHRDGGDAQQVLRLPVLAADANHVAESEHLWMPRHCQIRCDRDASGPVHVRSRRLTEVPGERGGGHPGRPDHRAGGNALLIVLGILDRDAVLVDVHHGVSHERSHTEMLQRARGPRRELRREAGQQPVDRLDQQDLRLRWID